jgi:N-methylhydantoinase B
VAAGDRVRLLTAGGGGHGEPGRRDPAAVREDVAEGYVSVAAAHDVYGVAV